MADTKTGGCHCGAVRYEVETDLAQVVTCNCSICTKHGYLLTFVATRQFALLSGQEDLTDYQFNSMSVHHLFCHTCGVAAFGRGLLPNGDEVVSINVRCLDDVDLAQLTLTSVDGKSL